MRLIGNTHVEDDYGLARISLGLSALEIAIIWIEVFFFRSSRTHHQLVVAIADWTWVLGSLGALVVGLCSLFRDQNKKLAIAAVVFAFIASFIGSIPLSS